MAEQLKKAVTKVVRVWEDSRPRRALVRLRASFVARLVSPTFWYGRYEHTFVERRPPTELGGSSELPRVIWAFWTGPNPMSDARRSGLEKLVAVNTSIPVTLVTPENLGEYVVEGHPLHSAYENLSYTHRSDYLRAYFLHHYGGAYSDIKPMLESWEGYFSRMEERGAWLLGTALPSPYEAGNNRGRLGKHLHRYYRSLVSGGALVVRSHTPLTAEWLREAERLLTYAAPALEEFPHDDRGDGDHAGYPLAWMDLLGDILQPLVLKYADHILVDPDAWWDTRADYR